MEKNYRSDVLKNYAEHLHFLPATKEFPTEKGIEAFVSKYVGLDIPYILAIKTG